MVTINTRPDGGGGGGGTKTQMEKVKIKVGHDGRLTMLASSPYRV